MTDRDRAISEQLVICQSFLDAYESMHLVLQVQLRYMAAWWRNYKAELERAREWRA